jgi:hypothetical protein
MRGPCKLARAVELGPLKCQALNSPRAHIQRELSRAGEFLGQARSYAVERSVKIGDRLGVRTSEVRHLSASRREDLAKVLSRGRQHSGATAARLQTLVSELGRLYTTGCDHFRDARWQARERSAQTAARVRAFFAEHRRISAAGAVALLLALALVGTAAAVLSAGRNANVVAVNYTDRYVTVTTPGGTTTSVVTLTTRAKPKTVRARAKPRVVTVKQTRARRRVVTGPGGASTIFESVAVPGPSNTKTVTGPTKTVTVTGPTQTVTEVVTSEITVTETVKKH